MRRVRAVKIGLGTDPEAEMDPLVTGQHLDRVRSYVDLGYRSPGGRHRPGFPRSIKPDAWNSGVRLSEWLYRVTLVGGAK